jgi:hypothetical protein
VQAFHDSVDDYLDFCGERKEAPEKPLSGKILVRISPELHRQASVAAKKSHKSLNAWVASAIEAQIDQERTRRKGRAHGAEDDEVKTFLRLLELRLVRELREHDEEPSSERHKVAEH